MTISDQQYRRCCTTLLLLLAFPLAAQQVQPQKTSPATTPSLEELLNTPLSDIPQQIEVSTSSRYQQSSTQSAAVTYVITAADIELFQYQSLAAILRSLPGIYISSDGVFQYVGVRGLGQPGDFNSRLLFLLDGVRINENVYDAGLLGSDALIDVENIDRIEFAAGPGSAVYGNNAFFGVVNILSKSAQQLRGAALRLTMRTDASNRYFFNTAHRLEQGSEWWFSASHEQKPEIPLELPAPESLTNAFEANNHETLSRFRIGGRHRGFRFQALWSDQHRYSPYLVGSPEGPVVASTLDRNDNYLVSLSHQHQLTDAMTLSGHLNQSQSRFRRDIPLYYPQLSYDQLATDQLGRWISADLMLHYQGLASHELVFGVEYQTDQRQHIEIFLNPPYELLQGFYGDNIRKAAFIQDQWQLSSAHSLVLGLRYDHQRISKPQRSPRLGWIWQFDEGQSLKLLHGRAYRAANLYEFAVNNSLFGETPREEQISSTELTWERQWSRRFSSRLSLFNGRIDQLIVTDPIDQLFINATEVRNQGTELDIDWRLTNGAQLSAAWSWQNSQDPDGQPLQNSPRHLIKMQYQQPLPWAGTQMSAALIGLSSRQVEDSRLPGYTLLQFAVHWQLAVYHQLHLSLYNAFNQPVLDRPTMANPPILQAGRSVGLSWRWQLW